MNASHLLVSSFGVLVATALACNAPPKEPRDGAATTAPSSLPASASPSALASAPPAAPAPASPSGCATDADCHLFSSYCPDSPCGCRALSATEPDPACAGSKVRCFADPCMRKAAQCQSGKCVVVAANVTAK